jgi:hypothetical protein
MRPAAIEAFGNAVECVAAAGITSM